MKKLINDARSRPLRHVSIGAYLAAALSLSAWAAVERGPFDGAVLVAALGGLLGLGLRSFPARPRLSVEFRTRAETGRQVLIGDDRTVRPLDLEAIIEEQAEAALGTMPVSPVPKAPPGSGVEHILSAHRKAIAFQAAAAGISEESLDNFTGEVENYRKDLRRWLTEFEHARGEILRAFVGAIRIIEDGSAAADHVRVRLFFPDGFEPSEAPPMLDRPPQRPTFSPSPVFASVYSSPSPQQVDPLSLKGDPTHWRYSQEGKLTVAECEPGRINQGHDRDTEQFELRAAPPGAYKIEWEISADGLRRPARGHLELKVAEPDADEPILTLADARAECERYEL